MEKNISTIIFDFGNVLIDLDIPGFHGRMHELTGLKEDTEEDVLGDCARAYERGQISTELFINQVIKLSNHTIQAREIIHCWNSMLLGIQPETLVLLKRLKNQYHTYILSNTNPLHIDWVHRHLQTRHQIHDFEKSYLHGAFYSHQLRLIKPDPEIYTRVQKHVSTPPDRILFIDDLEANVQGAQNVGWNAVIHPTGKNLKESLSPYISLQEWEAE